MFLRLQKLACGKKQEKSRLASFLLFVKSTTTVLFCCIITGHQKTEVINLLTLSALLLVETNPSSFEPTVLK